MKIYAPVTDFNGLRASVMFVKGVGETDDPALIEWFRKNGYRLGDTVTEVSPMEMPLEKCEEATENSVEKCDDPNFDSMNPLELREWMKANGLGNQIKNIRSKEKLLEIIRG